MLKNLLISPPKRLLPVMFGFLWLGSTANASAQAPTNDDPCGAIVLTAQGSLCTAPVVSTTANATTTAPSGYQNPAAGCGTASQPTDVWFKFTTAATGPASFGAALTVTGNPAGTVRLFSAAACQGPFTQLACSGSGQANTVAPRLTTGALQANTTYYVSVAGYAAGDPTGAFTICLTDGPGLPTCAAPTFGAISYGSPTTATIVYTPGVNNTTPVTVLVTGPAGFSQTTTSTTSPIQLTGLTQGTTYTVSLTAPCAASNQTAPVATTSITTPTRYCSTNLGTTCGFSNITDVSIAGTTLNNTSQAPACVTGGYSNFPAAGRTTATLQPGTPYSLTVKTANINSTDNVTAWLDFNQNGLFEATETIMPVGVASINIPRTVSFTIPLSALAGTTGLRVRSLASTFSGLGTGAACTSLVGGEVEDYTVTIGAPVGCPAPSGLAISNLTATAATLSFTPVPGAVSYTVTYSSYTGMVSTASYTLLTTTSPVQLTGLIQNSTSGVTVVANCGPGSASAPVTLSFITPQGPPINDECTNATLLVPGTTPVPTSGNTNFGTLTAPAPAPTSACTVPVNQDIWYRFVATGPAHNVVVAIDERGSILIDAFVGTCAGFTRLACSRHLENPGSNQTATVSLPLTNLIPGQTYYVRIGQSSTTSYAWPFDISIQTPGPSYCVGGLGGSSTCAGPNLTSTAIAGTSLNSVAPPCQSGTQGSTYTEYSASGSTTATLVAGTTYQLQTTVGSGPADIGLWIDYNQNFVFEPSEFTQVGLNVSSGATVAFTVPAGATAGATRLRLRSSAAGAGMGAADACTALTTGQTADFTVTIVVPVPTSCPNPTNVSAARNPANPFTALVVTFTAATPGVLGYVATATPTAGGAPITATGLASPLTITGLTPNTSYQICVASTCGGGVVSAPPVCATASTAPPCPGPTNVTVARSFNTPLTGLTVSFTAGTPGTTGTTVTATPTAGGTPVTVAGVSSPFTFTGLTPNTSYQVCVSSTCAGGITSAPPVCATVSTALPCAPATNLSLTRVGTSGNIYSFSWVGPPNGLGYAVSYTAPGGTPQSVPSSVSPVILSLQPGVAYTFSVSVDCGFNNGSSGATATFTTVVTSRQEELAAQVALYPNPAHHAATLIMPAALLHQPATISVRNALGQVVRHATMLAARADAQLTLDLAALPAGLYLVLLATEQGVLVKRLVVE